MIAAMCSGTIVLSDAQVIDGKKVTGYTGYQEKLQMCIRDRDNNHDGIYHALKSLDKKEEHGM